MRRTSSVATYADRHAIKAQRMPHHTVAANRDADAAAIWRCKQAVRQQCALIKRAAYEVAQHTLEVATVRATHGEVEHGAAHGWRQMEVNQLLALMLDADFNAHARCWCFVWIVWIMCRCRIGRGVSPNLSFKLICPSFTIRLG
jgi:hypothetical protein